MPEIALPGNIEIITRFEHAFRAADQATIDELADPGLADHNPAPGHEPADRCPCSAAGPAGDLLRSNGHRPGQLAGGGLDERRGIRVTDQRFGAVTLL
jgi:hypothetical protein